MANRTDILTDESNDLQIVNGDLVTGQSDEQHVQHILLAFPGTYRRVPALGAGLPNALNGAVNARLERNIRESLKLDAYEVKRLKFDNGKLEVEV